jgi:hypothetical protein
MLHFTLHGTPRTKKTSNRVFRSGPKGRIRFVPSAAHEAWKARVLPQAFRIAREHGGLTPIITQVNVRAHFYRDALRGDAVGYYQALGDLLQAAGIVTNDVLIASWDGSRLMKDAHDPRIEIWITHHEKGEINAAR